MEQGTVQSHVNDQPASPFWVNRYLVFPKLQPKDTVTITFPMVETTETYTLKWKEKVTRFVTPAVVKW